MKVILATLLCVSLCGAQALSYSRLPGGELAPSGRADGTIAYDLLSRQLYLFGGQADTLQNDLWVYALDEQRWRVVAVTGDLPAARLGHTLLWDARRSRLILFGGQSRGFFSDVWAFDPARGSWQQLARDDAGPSRRYGHSAILEPGRDRMVISHGFTNAGRFDDTWAFDLANNSWRNLTPSGTKPVRRCLHHAVHDAAGGRMLLYGGCASGSGPCPLGDLWAFDLSSSRWTELTGATRPPPREHYGVAFDDARGRLLLFGGSGGGLLNDTWEFSGTAWQAAVIQGASPEPRARHQGVFATDRKAAFFFGGRTNSGQLTNELWMLSPAMQGPIVTGVRSAFGGDGEPVAPGQLVSIFGSGLGPTEGVAFSLDETGRLPLDGAGVSVTWNGIPAPLNFARADQVNVQVPYELSGAMEARLVVTANGQIAESTVPVAPIRPSLFSGVWNQDGSQNSSAKPARGGDVVVLYATGQGVTSPPTRTGTIPVGGYPEPATAVTVTIGGEAVEVLFRGQAPGTVGVMQLNVRVPDGVGPASAPVVLRIGDATSQPVGVYLEGS